MKEYIQTQTKVSMSETIIDTLFFACRRLEHECYRLNGNDETGREERYDDVSCIATRMMMNFKQLPSIRSFFTLKTTYVGCLLGGEDDLGILWDATVWRLELDQLWIGSA